MQILLRPVLITAESLKLKDWNGTEWFGIDWPYAPFWDVNEEHYAYGLYKEDAINFSIDEHFDYIAVFLAGEFVCSFELNNVYEAPLNLYINNVSFIKDTKGIKNAICSS